jgi:hypothetical protein
VESPAKEVVVLCQRMLSFEYLDQYGGLVIRSGGEAMNNVSVLVATSKISVATVMTDVFQKNGIIVSRKLAKIVRIFVDIGHNISTILANFLDTIIPFF